MKEKETINMEKITYILPVHKFDETVKTLTEAALNSIINIEGNENDRIITVGPKEVVKSVKELYDSLGSKLPLTVVENEGKTDYFSQVNLAVSRCVTEYFSVIEYDDTYKPFWRKGLSKYVDEGSVIIPIYEVVSNGKFDSFANEISWSPAFSENEQENLGRITEKELSVYMDFYINGGIIKTEDFISIGGFKPSLKIASPYEFLLRADYKDKKIFVAPKIAYSHTVGRSDSYSEISFNEISKEEGKWLIDTAKKEYFFKEDREKVFNKENDEK